MPHSGEEKRSVGTAVAVFVSAGYQLLLTAAIIGGAYAYAPPDEFMSHLRKMVASWDARHYLTIAREGYASTGVSAPLVVFFPLYPALIAVLAPLWGYLKTGLAITAIASVAGHVLLFRYLDLLGFDRRRAFRVAALVFAMPAAVYFAAIYTEALYFLLTMIFVLLLRREAWLAAALCGFLAALTRNMGALFVIPFLAACWAAGPRSRFWRRAWPVVFIGGGTLVYLGINYLVQGDPLAFLTHQAANWGKSSGNPLSMYLRELGALLRSGGRIPESYELTYVDRVATILFPLLLIDHLLGLWTPPGGGERLPPGFFAWALAQYLVVCSQSFWVSNTRYLALILPAYLMLERALDNRPVFFAWMLASGGTAAWAIRNYANMHWVF